MRVPFMSLAAALVLTAFTASPAALPAVSADPEVDSALAAYDTGDFAAALRGFELAGARGVADAQYMAGLMHHRGRGTAVNGREAVRWYSLAADQNHAAALANLGIVYRDGAGEGGSAVKPDAEKAIVFLRRSAFAENSAGQLAYAAMLINTRRSKADLLEGVAFMRICADGGNQVAQDNLEDLELSDEDSAAADARRKEIEAVIAAARASPRRPAAADAGTNVPKTGTPDGTAAGANDPAGRTVAASGGGVLRFRRVVVRDPMISNIEALTMLVPAGWTFDGRIEWLLNDSVLANPVWRIADPATGLEMVSLPFRQFTWSPGGFMPVGSNHLGMTVLPPIRDPAEFVARFWAPAARPHLAGLAPAGVRELPALAAQAVREWGGAAPVECRAYRLRYAYARGENEWEEDVTFALLYTGNDPTVWIVTHGHASSAPGGVLDRLAPVTSAVYASGEYTSRWRAGWRVCYDLFLKRAAQEIIEARKLAAAVAEHRGQMDEIARELEKDRDASSSARHRALSEALGGIETYADPSAGRNVELPQGYPAAWVNQRGEYLLSPRPDFDPNAPDTRIEGDWKPMTKVDPMAGRR